MQIKPVYEYYCWLVCSDGRFERLSECHWERHNWTWPDGSPRSREHFTAVLYLRPKEVESLQDVKDVEMRYNLASSVSIQDYWHRRLWSDMHDIVGWGSVLLKNVEPDMIEKVLACYQE